MDFALGGDVIETMTQKEFVSWFRVEFAPAIEGQKLARDFKDLHQTTKIVVEIIFKLMDRALYVSQYAIKEEMKKTKYNDMLRYGISEFVNFLACWILEDMIARSQERENDLEHLRKMKSKQV